jgi:hypothetical protein
MRKTVLSVFVCLLTMSGLPAFAQTNNPNSPNVSKPSEQNSGAGVPGFAGNKNGPAAKRGTVGSSAATGEDRSVREQDSSGVKGLPGNKSGPPAKAPSH